MAEARPFRALRYNTALVDPAVAIAPPYDVISPPMQRSLYERSPYNIVRIEYGEQRDGDNGADNRYTRAAADLSAWRDADVLVQDEAPAIYHYRQAFSWAGRRYERDAYFAAVRLEPWDAGIVKPHEHTLANPKADRMELLRATRTQVSPVYSLYRGARIASVRAAPFLDVEADGQRHVVSAVTDTDAIAALSDAFANAEVYIADGHHRYETALAYRDEVRAKGNAWSGGEPENFVLMALTASDDRGLLVLPTHRLVKPPRMPDGALARIAERFDVREIAAGDAEATLQACGGRTAFVALGIERDGAHLLTLRDRDAVDRTMPADQPAAWKQLDVSVLQYAILRDIFGIDDAALAAGGAVSYTQDAGEAQAAVASGDARMAFLLNATPVEQVLAVADAGGRMPQKSTFFYPKLPTGLVLRFLD